MKDNEKFVNLTRVSVIETKGSLLLRSGLKFHSHPWMVAETKARLKLLRRLKAKSRKLGLIVMAQGYRYDGEEHRLWLLAICRPPLVECGEIPNLSAKLNSKNA